MFMMAQISILSIASEFSFMGDGMWQLFLQSLQNITFAHRDGRQVRVPSLRVCATKQISGLAALQLSWTHVVI